MRSETEKGPEDSPFCVLLAVGEEIGVKLTHGETLALMDALSRAAEEIDPDRENVQKGLGEGVKIAREGLNISIEDFAANMHRTPETMRAWEAGVGMTKEAASVLTRALEAMARRVARRTA